MAEFCLNAWIRIDSSNKSIRVKKNGVDTTFTFTEGLYWFGFGNGGPDGDSDQNTYGTTSFLDHFKTTVGFNVSVENTANQILGTPGATGHVHIEGLLAGDNVQWSHADTTVDLAWFGVAPGTTTTTIGASYTDVSDFSSSCVFLGLRNIYADRLVEEYLENTIEADSGDTQTQFYAKRQKRWLEFKVEGIPRSQTDLGDSSYHTLRRFISTLHTSLASRRFYYIPAMDEADDWDPDADYEGPGIGFQDMQLDTEQGTIHFDDVEEYQGYNNFWRKGFFAKTYGA